tara:strand:- start:174 stop:611 length:438 start_codon:yes stop_codon:yes gene_type:complete
MSSLLEISWLIPGFPLAGAALIGFLLVSFNRTVNRLTKPISFFLITCVAFSTIISFIFFLNEVDVKAFEFDFDFGSIAFHFNFYLNLFIEKTLSIAGLVIILTMLSCYYTLDRKKGYVRFISFLTALSGIVFFIILNGTLSDLLV